MAMKINRMGINLVDRETGELVAVTTPSFQKLTYEDYIRDGLKHLDPMTAQELEREDIKNYIHDNMVVAEEKFDGHRALNHLTKYGNRLFSRRISKETGWYSENTDQAPHIRDIQLPSWMHGTVLDNEALMPVEGCSCRTMQGVMGALPETAIENQLEKGFAYLNCFDILYYCGTNVQAMPYWRRKLYEFKIVKAIKSPFIKFVDMYATRGVYLELLKLWKDNVAYDPDILKYVHVVDNYDDLFIKFVADGKEGLILKNINDKYVQKRSKSFLKMKSHRMYDVVIMGYEEPTAEVDLSERKTKEEDWLYWESYEKDLYCDGMPVAYDRNEICPVSRFYALGWIGAVKFGVWKDYDLHELIAMGYSGDYFDELEDKGLIKCKGKVGACLEYKMLVEVGQTSGFTDNIRQAISEDREAYLGRVIEVEAQHIINAETGSLQHPRFVQFRDDKDSEQCTFEDHIRKYGEDL